MLIAMIIKFIGIFYSWYFHWSYNFFNLIILCSARIKYHFKMFHTNKNVQHSTKNTNFQTHFLFLFWAIIYVRREHFVPFRSLLWLCIIFLSREVFSRSLRFVWNHVIVGTISKAFAREVLSSTLVKRSHWNKNGSV